MTRMLIRTKIILASLGSLAAVAVFAVFIIYIQSQLAVTMGETLQNVSTIGSAEKIKYNLILYHDLILRYAMTGDKSLLEEVAQTRDKVLSAISQMKGLITEKKELGLLAQIEKNTYQFDQDASDFLRGFKTPLQIKQPTIRIHVQGGSMNQEAKSAISVPLRNSQPILDAIYSDCDELSLTVKDGIKSAKLAFDETIPWMRRMTYIAGAGLFGATMFFGFMLALSIITPLQILLRGVRRAASGQSGVHIPVLASDEIGELTQEFNSMIVELEKNQKKLLAENVTDSLTGLNNFRSFQEHLANEVPRAARYKRPFILLILDIDHFKHFNDTNGHQMGNEALKTVAAKLKGTLRSADFVARYGGEEFVAILHETTQELAQPVLERVRNAVESASIPGGDKQPLGKLTVSIGAACFLNDSSEGPALIECADKALYTAKETGRNRVIWFSEVNSAAQEP